MCNYRASYKHISRDVFNRISDRLKDDHGIDSHITIYYNGTNRYGDLTIEGQGGYGKEYKEALRVFNEEYCDLL